MASPATAAKLPWVHRSIPNRQPKRILLDKKLWVFETTPVHQVFVVEI
jgi:hypothetical protein